MEESHAMVQRLLICQNNFWHDICIFKCITCTNRRRGDFRPRVREGEGEGKGGFPQEEMKTNPAVGAGSDDFEVINLLLASHCPYGTHTRSGLRV